MGNQDREASIAPILRKLLGRPGALIPGLAAFRVPDSGIGEAQLYLESVEILNVDGVQLVCRSEVENA